MICNLLVSPGCIWRAEDNSMQDPGLPTLFLFPFLLLLFFLLFIFDSLNFNFLKPKRWTGTKGGKGDRA